MPTNAETLSAAFDSHDLGRLIELMDARVVWRGIVDESHGADHVIRVLSPPCHSRYISPLPSAAIGSC